MKLSGAEKQLNAPEIMAFERAINVNFIREEHRIMKIKIIISLLVAIALTLINSNTALSEEQTEPSSNDTNSSEVCVDENGNKYPCPQ